MLRRAAKRRRYGLRLRQLVLGAVALAAADAADAAVFALNGGAPYNVASLIERVWVGSMASSVELNPRRFPSRTARGSLREAVESTRLMCSGSLRSKSRFRFSSARTSARPVRPMGRSSSRWTPQPRTSSKEALPVARCWDGLPERPDPDVRRERSLNLRCSGGAARVGPRPGRGRSDRIPWERRGDGEPERRPPSNEPFSS
jgi:hypothetical protein